MVIIAIIVAAAINFGVGMLYYKFLGEAWAKAYNFNMEDLEATPLHMLGAVAVSLLIAIGICTFISFSAMNNIVLGAQVGFFAWLFFVAPTQFSGVIWCNKPFQGFLIDTGCNVISFTLAGAAAGLLL